MLYEFGSQAGFMPNGSFLYFLVSMCVFQLLFEHGQAKCKKNAFFHAKCMQVLGVVSWYVALLAGQLK